MRAPIEPAAACIAAASPPDHASHELTSVPRLASLSQKEHPIPDEHYSSDEENRRPQDDRGRPFDKQRRGEVVVEQVEQVEPFLVTATCGVAPRRRVAPTK